VTAPSRGPERGGWSPEADPLVRVSRRLHDAVNRLAIAMAYLSGLGFLLAAVYIAVDVLGRKFVGVSSGVTDELGGYSLVFGATAALAFALATGAHVRIDVLMPYLPRRVQGMLSYAAYLAMAVFAALLAWYSWKLAIDSFLGDARATSILQTRLFVPQGLMALGFTLLAVEASVMLVAGVLESVRSHRLAEFRLLQVSDLSEGL
jgi:TRAP-type C4-dicarboxylate transport system permease small subunit